MNSLLSQINQLPNVKNARFLEFSSDCAVKEGWADNPEAVMFCQKHAELVDAVHFYYPSSQGDVAGICVAPKQYIGELPCVVFNRGGYGEFGMLNQRLTFGFLSMIASWGYCVIGSQYAGNDGGEGKDEYGGRDVEDVLSLKPILDQLSCSDSSRIGMLGLSRGAINSWQAISKVDWVNALVLQGGVFDLVQMAEERPPMETVFQECFDGSLKAKQARSLLFQTNKLPRNIPILILHGALDWRVHPNQAIELSKQCLGHSIPHRLIIYEGSGHEIYERGKEKNFEIKKWLERFVMNREKLSTHS